MFLLDSLMISGLRWVLDTVTTAADAELNDDSALRDQLLEAEMRREMGEISNEEFKEIETDLLARIREIKERREGSGPLEFGAQPIEATEGDTFAVEASVTGDFHDRSERSDRSNRSDRSTGAAATEEAPPTKRTTRTRRTAQTARTK